MLFLFGVCRLWNSVLSIIEFEAWKKVISTVPLPPRELEETVNNEYAVLDLEAMVFT